MANKNNTVNKDNTTVKGTANNVGQEITKQMPSTDVISCTMTEEEHQARVERIHTKMEQGLRLSWDIIVDIASAKERNEQELDGYTKSADDFNKWANELFGMGETQVKQAIRLVGFYGSIDDKGEYSLDDKYKRFTKEKLDIIQRIPQLKTKAQFDEVCDTFGIMPNTSEGVLKEIVKEAKGITDKSESKEDKEAKKQKKEKEQSTAEIKASVEYKELESKRDILLKFTGDYYTKVHAYCEKVRALKKDEPLSTDAITEMVAIFLSYERDFKEVEKEYNGVGKDNK